MLVTLSLLASAIPDRSYAQVVASDEARPIAKTRPSNETDARVAAFSARRVRVNVRNALIQDALSDVAGRAGLKLTFSQELVNNLPRVTARIMDAPVNDAFATILRGTGLRVVITPSGHASLIRDDESSVSQERTGTVRGTVVDSARHAVGHATITVAGTKISASASATGAFVLHDVPAGERVLTAKLLGYRPTTQPVTVSSGDTVTVRIVMPSAATMLSGVVTTATGVQKKLDVGNDITRVNVDSLRQVAPISSVTDLIDGHVPGLVVTRSSGAPGAPARVRVRGIGSINASNDPIVVVNGVRTYSNQTKTSEDANYSVLNNIDVNSIETIEVMKGPSASALYGSDAANGVIVITTKRGTSGPARWTFGMDQMRTTQPRTFPTLYYREGTDVRYGTRGHCTLGYTECTDDSLIVFSPLNNPRTTVLGTGSAQRYYANVSGGSATLQYALSGESTRDQGLLKMSESDVDYLVRTTGRAVPNWQRRPQGASTTGATSRLTLQATPALFFDITNQLTQSARRTTPLDNAIAVYTGQSIAPRDTSLVTSDYGYLFRVRNTNEELSFRNSLSTRWTPLTWWSMNGDAGYDLRSRETRSLLRRGDCNTNVQFCATNTGTLTSERTRPAVTTLNIVSHAQLPTALGVRLRPAIGANYVRSTNNDVAYSANGLALGSSTNSGAQTTTLGPDISSTLVQLGLFAETGISLFNERVSTTLGTRIDASSALGKAVRPTYPKLDLSYLLSNERFFPFRDVVNSLRLRFAYGHAAVQPEVGAASRAYKGSTDAFGNPVQVIGTLGNPELRPERTKELEGGFDLGLFEDRFTLGVTGYRKHSDDALVQIRVPESVGGGVFWTNLGSVRNVGAELALNATLLRRSAASLSINGTYSQNSNTLLKFSADGGLLSSESELARKGYGTRFVEGYPIDGTWFRPIAAYADTNSDGIIGDKEILRADTSVFVGGPLPKYTSTFGAQVGVLNDRLMLVTQFQYENGRSLANSALLDQITLTGPGSTLRALNDASTPLAEQAAMRSGYTALRTVSLLRLQSLSLRFLVPETFARRVRASSMSVALQGSNLALWTTYSGSDPNVSSILRDLANDTGILPMPRTWGLNVSLNF